MKQPGAPKSTKVTVTFPVTVPQGAHIEGSGYTSITFDGEVTVVNNTIPGSGRIDVTITSDVTVIDGATGRKYRKGDKISVPVEHLNAQHA
jgi:hypothetical protein